MRRLPFIGVAVAIAAASACSPPGAPEREAKQKQGEPEPQVVDIPQTVTEVAPGTTPMAERVAVIGLLNKRNGISRDLTLRPGQAVRLGDVVVRLRACETTAPWEEQRLTGAFIQLDVRNAQGQFQRVFSGWVYKESPSLNVVEHPVYDAWPRSCAMTHPEAGESTVRAGSAESNRSSAPNSPAPAAGRPARPAAPAPDQPSPKAADSDDR
ncbi:MAG: hypothetical protein QOI38_854 [Sphingomonadales bacterium]|jgi:hypothetical protein|nr:hypothetical protein [Sphingomonadales bacterium]